MSSALSSNILAVPSGEYYQSVDARIIVINDVKSLPWNLVLLGVDGWEWMNTSAP